MCGVAGVLTFAGGPPASLPAMLAHLARRGPDDEGEYAAGPVRLGHRRLAILDLSPAGHQPMVDKELALVFNGCIYNHAALRAELAARGHTFASHSDTEVILKAYRTWGQACLERLDGMFAFALWDGAKQALFLARDRLGIKPLYYTVSAAAFRFASNVQALLVWDDVDTTPDAVALHHQMTLHAVVPAPHTVLAGVRKLPPAHGMWVQADGTQRQWRYWDVSARRPEKRLSENEWLEETRRLLRAAVAKRLTADVPVGVLLSGGLDSSLITALVAEVSPQPVHTFAVGFEDSPEEAGDEFAYSDAVAAHFGTRHRRWHIANHEVLAALPAAIAAMSEPMVSQDVVSWYLLSRLVASHVKVVLSGQGADEAFAGYFWYPRMHADALALGVAGEPPAGMSREVWRQRRLQAFARHYFDRSHADWCAAVEPAWYVPDVTSAWVTEALTDSSAETFLDAVLKFDVTTLIVDDPVKRVDNMTMAWGLEARVPFLDPALVAHALAMPSELKLREGGKWPLKAIARGWLPDVVIDRPKGYFPMPALKYLRGAFYELMADVLTSRAARERGIFRPEYIAALLADPERYRTPLGGAMLWHAAALELWWQQVVDRRSERYVQKKAGH